MPRVLLIKTSSMGDVIHCLPAATDMQRHIPDLQLDWVVEEGFADIPRLHPVVNKIIPVAIRRWRKNLFSKKIHQEFAAFRQTLQQQPYDLVLDTQGLLKSAWIGRMVDAPYSGYDRQSIREPLASWFYRQKFAVSRQLHAVQRNRQLAAQALGYMIDPEIDYGLSIEPQTFAWLPSDAYVVGLHATSRADKEWPEPHWIELAQKLAALGLKLVLPWGSTQEHQRAERLAKTLPNAIVAPRLNLQQAAALLAGARLVVGVDTGLTHLAAAVGVPVIALYCASEPGLTGVLGKAFAVNLGGMADIPSVGQTWGQVQQVLAA
ncbi:MAG: lipopolysaccharide heptosyltransferase I [Neisseriaceae bacterium]|nr:MAG: lipopolysaccharide heptosyltransferase I [Neisseriaceae bacterium]